MSVVKAIGKARNLQVGHYCFKCRRLVPDKEKVKIEEEFI
jgi:hypothetical protein